jgi:hypothetical protein
MERIRCRASTAVWGIRRNAHIWRFWDSTIEKPSDQRVRAFFDMVVAAYPDLFHVDDLPRLRAHHSRVLYRVTIWILRGFADVGRKSRPVFWRG